MSVEMFVIILLMVVNIVLVVWCMILDNQKHQLEGYIERIEREYADLFDKQAIRSRAKR